MPHRANVESLLADLARSVGLPGLALDEDDRASLVFDGRTRVDLEFDEPGNRLVLVSELGVLPARERAAMLRTLLGGNALGSTTKGSTLALEPETEAVILQRDLAQQQLGYAAFEALLAAYVEAAESWAGVLAGRPAAGTAEPMARAADFQIWG